MPKAILLTSISILLTVSGMFSRRLKAEAYPWYNNKICVLCNTAHNIANYLICFIMAVLSVINIFIPQSLFIYVLIIFAFQFVSNQLFLSISLSIAKKRKKYMIINSFEEFLKTENISENHSEGEILDMFCSEYLCVSRKDAANALKEIRKNDNI